MIRFANFFEEIPYTTPAHQLLKSLPEKILIRLISILHKPAQDSRDLFSDSLSLKYSSQYTQSSP
jgi:hypothetical protein